MSVKSCPVLVHDLYHQILSITNMNGATRKTTAVGTAYPSVCSTSPPVVRFVFFNLSFSV